MTALELFLVLVVVSHFAFSLGFLRWDYFFSLGYALAIFLLAITGFFAARSDTSTFALLHLGGLSCYGLRLGYHVVKRDFFLASYRETLHQIRAQSDQLSTGGRLGIWMSVSWLSPLMVSPIVYLRERDPGSASAILGLGAMVVGLALETLADHQKAKYKLVHGNTFCPDGLYRLCRHPNYVGDMLFWSGVWLTGISTYQTPGAWALTLTGLAGIVGTMIFMTRHTERHQLQRYGKDATFLAYAANVPILLPFVPVYTFNPGGAGSLDGK